jgi:hypothetical protein
MIAETLLYGLALFSLGFFSGALSAFIRADRQARRSLRGG